MAQCFPNKPLQLVISCEHAENAIPDEYLELFANYHTLLQAHNGYDIGAKDLTENLGIYLSTENSQIMSFSILAKYSRLLIDLNRSTHNPRLFSPITRSLPKKERQIIIAEYYQPYRTQLQNIIAEKIASNCLVLHLSVHSFTPVLQEIVRNNDIGLLYDPKSYLESLFVKSWRTKFQILDPKLKVRLNYPYKGHADGMTTYFRKLFGVDNYLGIELEVNQKHFLLGPNIALQEVIMKSLSLLL